MKKLLFLVVTAPFLFPILSRAQTSDIHFEHGSLAQAYAKADSAKKLIFVDCYTVWCAPCKGMAAHVFTQDSVAAFFNASFINVKMDMEKGEGPSMAVKYNVTAYPTFLLLDANGNMVYKFVGGMESDQFLKKAREGINPKNRVAVMNRQYKEGNRSKAFLRDYIKLKIEMMETESGKAIAADYFNRLTPKERASAENWFLFGENRYSLYLSNIYSNNFNYLAEHWKEFTKATSKDSIHSKLAAAYRQIAGYSLRGWYFKTKPYSKADFDRYRTQLKATELEDKDQLITLIDMAQAAGEKDSSGVVNILADHIGSFSEENRRIVFDFLSMFNGRRSAIETNARTKEILEKIVQTSSNTGLVNTAKNYLDRLIKPM
jgi:thiol-disulfide isomerase/thioredoxin